MDDNDVGGLTPWICRILYCMYTSDDYMADTENKVIIICIDYQQKNKQFHYTMKDGHIKNLKKTLSSDEKTIQFLLDGIEHGWPPAQCLLGELRGSVEKILNVLDPQKLATPERKVCILKAAQVWEERVSLMKAAYFGMDSSVSKENFGILSNGGDLGGLLHFCLQDNAPLLDGFGASWHKEAGIWNFFDRRFDLLKTDVSVFCGRTWVPGDPGSIYLETNIKGIKFYVEVILGSWVYGCMATTGSLVRHSYAAGLRPSCHTPSRFLLAMTGIIYPTEYEWAIFSKKPMRRQLTHRIAIIKSAEVLKKKIKAVIEGRVVLFPPAGQAFKLHTMMTREEEEKSDSKIAEADPGEKQIIEERQKREERERFERKEHEQKAAAAILMEDRIKKENADRSALRKQARKGVVPTMGLGLVVHPAEAAAPVVAQDQAHLLLKDHGVGKDADQQSRTERRKANKAKNKLEKQVHKKKLEEAAATKALFRVDVAPDTKDQEDVVNIVPKNINRCRRRPKKQHDVFLCSTAPTRAEAAAMDLQRTLWHGVLRKSAAEKQIN